MSYRDREAALKRLADPIVWNKADGTKVLVCDMSDGHIANSLRMLHRMALAWLDKNRHGLSPSTVKALSASPLLALRACPPTKARADILIDEWKHRFRSEDSWVKFAELMDRKKRVRR